MLYTVIILAIIICVLLVLIILIQNPKGGGLSSGFAGSNNIMGVQRTGDFLEKGTWILAVSLMVLALMVNVVVPRGGVVIQEMNDMLSSPLNKLIN
jgi:preprotein translocase subunit SecG